MRIIVIGSPGAGKGTYTQDLVKILNLVHVSSGDLFRDNIKASTDLGKKAQEFINAGKLVPDALTIDMVKERLSRNDCCQQGFILDGFPRTLEQAKALEKITELDLVINFRSEDKIIIGRLSGRIVCRKCGRIYHLINLLPKKPGICDLCDGELYQREDDKSGAVKARLATYNQQAAPLLEFYRQKSLLKEITINEEYGKFKDIILERIMKIVKSR